MAPVEYPIAPTATKRRGTLLDAATLSDRFTRLDGVALFDSYNCLTFDARADYCAPNSKDLDQGAGWIDGFRFAAYGGVTCRTIGLDQSRMESEIARAFATGESTAVEMAMMEIGFRASAGTAEVPGTWSAPTDITPAGGAVAPAVGFALLEEYAAGVYVGAPTIHSPISIASIILATDGLNLDGDVLRTGLGSKVAAGAGYGKVNTSPAGVAAAAGVRWVYATGEVLVARSEEISVVSVDTTNNDVVALAERGYVVAYDCFAAAIQVKVE
jgi:hypothetical protein